MEQPHPQILSPCSSRRRGGRRSCDTNSPEFEFCMVGNPSFPQPNLHSADELFSGGFLLPLHLLQLSTEPLQPRNTEATVPEKIPEPEPSTTTSAADSSATAALNNSKRWRHLFKKNDHSSKEKDALVREKREKKNGGAVGLGAGSVVSAAELNINIWPFSRSRSAGNGGARQRPPAARKVSSAPCSRSNSTGESKSRKWAHSPNRAGVHLGRNSPVWQLRRGGGGGGRSSEAFAEKGARRDGNDGRRKFPASKARVLNLNVPMCIGYRNHLSCRHDESSAVSIAAVAADGGGVSGNRIEGGAAGEVIRRSNLFNIRSLFTKKVH